MPRSKARSTSRAGSAPRPGASPSGETLSPVRPSVRVVNGIGVLTYHQMTHVDVAIIGSGFGGLGTAIRLKQEGIDDFVILERAQDVGGVWRDNTYPGCACDV